MQHYITLSFFIILIFFFFKRTALCQNLPLHFIPQLYSLQVDYSRLNRALKTSKHPPDSPQPGTSCHHSHPGKVTADQGSSYQIRIFHIHMLVAVFYIRFAWLYISTKWKDVEIWAFPMCLL